MNLVERYSIRERKCRTCKHFHAIKCYNREERDGKTIYYVIVSCKYYYNALLCSNSDTCSFYKEK